MSHENLKCNISSMLVWLRDCCESHVLGEDNDEDTAFNVVLAEINRQIASSDAEPQQYNVSFLTSLRARIERPIDHVNSLSSVPWPEKWVLESYQRDNQEPGLYAFWFVFFDMQLKNIDESVLVALLKFDIWDDQLHQFIIYVEWLYSVKHVSKVTLIAALRHLYWKQDETRSAEQEDLRRQELLSWLELVPFFNELELGQSSAPKVMKSEFEEDKLMIPLMGSAYQFYTCFGSESVLYLLQHAPLEKDLRLIVAATKLVNGHQVLLEALMILFHVKLIYSNDEGLWKRVARYVSTCSDYNIAFVLMTDAEYDSYLSRLDPANVQEHIQFLERMTTQRISLIAVARLLKLCDVMFKLKLIDWRVYNIEQEFIKQVSLAPDAVDKSAYNLLLAYLLHAPNRQSQYFLQQHRQIQEDLPSALSEVCVLEDQAELIAHKFWIEFNGLTQAPQSQPLHHFYQTVRALAENTFQSGCSTFTLQSGLNFCLRMVGLANEYIRTPTKNAYQIFLEAMEAEIDESAHWAVEVQPGLLHPFERLSLERSSAVGDSSLQTGTQLTSSNLSRMTSCNAIEEWRPDRSVDSEPEEKEKPRYQIRFFRGEVDSLYAASEGLSPIRDRPMP